VSLLNASAGSCDMCRDDTASLHALNCSRFLVFKYKLFKSQSKESSQQPFTCFLCTCQRSSLKCLAYCPYRNTPITIRWLFTFLPAIYTNMSDYELRSELSHFKVSGPITQYNTSGSSSVFSYFWCVRLTFWRRNYFFLFYHALYIKCE
jgi:hypothetical protein